MSGKPLAKVTYADLVEMERTDIRGATETTNRPAATEGAPFASKSTPLASKFASKSDSLASKLASVVLPANIELPANPQLPATSHLPANERAYPSWQVPKVTFRIPNELQDGLRFLAMSRNASFQDMLLLAISSLLATEGLLASGVKPANLPANADCQLVDQMIDDDATSTSTSSIIKEPRDLLEYYARWTQNPIREKDWETVRRLAGYNAIAIQTGILLSVLRTKTRVNSLKYCIGAIDEAAKAGPNLNYLRWLETKAKTIAQCAR